MQTPAFPIVTLQRHQPLRQTPTASVSDQVVELEGRVYNREPVSHANNIFTFTKCKISL
jgi:hypothetical protein